MSVDAGAAKISAATNGDYSGVPVTSVQSVTPQVMLTMSRDHQYWFKAYNDYSDIDADGVVETTYDDTFTYYGYFHSELCYTYDDSDDRFELKGRPTAQAINTFAPARRAPRGVVIFLIGRR